MPQYPKKFPPEPPPVVNTGPSMRAATKTERLGDKFRNFFEGLSQQPIARVGDAIGMSNFRGINDTFSTPPDPNKVMGAAPGIGPKNLVGPTAKLAAKILTPKPVYNEAAEMAKLIAGMGPQKLSSPRVVNPDSVKFRNNASGASIGGGSMEEISAMGGWPRRVSNKMGGAQQHDVATARDWHGGPGEKVGWRQSDGSVTWDELNPRRVFK